MGGAVGLKGTDGKSILQKAIALGAKPVATQRAETFLSELSSVKPHLTLIVGAGEMGEGQARKLTYTYRPVGEDKKETSSEDTKTVAKAILDAGVDLLVFVEAERQITGSNVADAAPVQRQQFAVRGLDAS